MRQASQGDGANAQDQRPINPSGSLLGGLVSQPAGCLTVPWPPAVSQPSRWLFAVAFVHICSPASPCPGSWAPLSSGGALSPTLGTERVCPLNSHSSLAPRRGSTARAMAARRLNSATCISWRQRARSELASALYSLRVVAISAAKASVRVTAGCGRPSAVHTIGR